MNHFIEYDAQQSAYLLDYDRRRILSCADTFQNLAAVFSEMNRDEEEEEENREEEQDRERILRLRQIRESRRQYAVYMRQMAGLMQSVAGTKVHLIRLGGRQEKQIVRALAGEGILVQDIYLLRGQEDRVEISISLCTKKDSSVTVEDIAGYLSVLTDIRLVPEKRNPYFIGMEPVNLYFEEEPAFCYMTAAATAIKENETVSGDSYSFFEEDNGLTVILSDGVGSGGEAARDSSRIVDLTERILDAGLGTRMAVQMLNSMVGAEGDENRMSTLDICRIDLGSGECSIVKAGAASTFIKRGPLVEKISSSELPLGMIAGEGGEENIRQLKDGDMLILISDGVTQNWPCGDGEFFLEQQIEKMDISSPVDMANLLLRYAIEQCQGKIRDDMTVLAAGVWENRDADE